GPEIVFTHSTRVLVDVVANPIGAAVVDDALPVNTAGVEGQRGEDGARQLELPEIDVLRIDAVLLPVSFDRPVARVAAFVLLRRNHRVSIRFERGAHNAVRLLRGALREAVPSDLHVEARIGKLRLDARGDTRRAAASGAGARR